MGKILAKALQFIYAGENERPVRPINFRQIKEGGLGLIDPILKSKVFYIKNMKTEFEIDGRSNSRYLKSHMNEYCFLKDNNLLESNTKLMYAKLIETITHKNGSLIPSRSERRSRGIRWKVSWRNLGRMKGLNPEEREFGWKMCQDMLEVGDRLHRKGSNKGMVWNVGVWKLWNTDFSFAKGLELVPMHLLKY